MMKRAVSSTFGKEQTTYNNIPFSKRAGFLDLLCLIMVSLPV
jgi:hypothetical protein